MREAQQRLNSRDFAELMAEERLCPRGPERDDVRIAIAASALYNIQLAKGSKRTTFRDFMPRFTQKPKQSGKEIYTKLKAFFMAFTRRKADGNSR